MRITLIAKRSSVCEHVFIQKHTHPIAVTKNLSENPCVHTNTDGMVIRMDNHFPEQWASQTRPSDPDNASKRKRRNKKMKEPKRDDSAINPGDNNNMILDFPTTEPKRQCMGTAASDDIAMNHISEPKTEDASSLSNATNPQTQLEDSRRSLLSNVTNSHHDLLSNVSKSASTSSSTSFRPVVVPVATTDLDETLPPILLDIHSLISRLPYQQMLNQVFTDDASTSSNVPVVTRAYEESFMREPMHAHERKCVCGDNCEFNFIDPHMPFTGVEFTLSGTAVDSDGSGSKTAQMGVEPAQMCVLCSRRTTQELFYNMVYNGQRFRGVIQRYGNLCQQPGEYAREAMLICPQNGFMHNMPLPIVAHHRHRYSVYSQNGTRFLRQHMVGAEDF